MNASDQLDPYAKWKALIEEQEKSGQSQAEFCKQHEITIAQLGYYRGILKNKNRPEVKSRPLFSPVQIKKLDIKTSSEIKITLPNGFHCYFPSHTEAMQIKKLIEVLLAC